MTYRNRALLDLAHEMPCMVKMLHNCNAHLGCHPMHADWQEWGRGHGHRAPDWAFAAGCGNAHQMLGKNIGGGMPQEERKAEWLRAFISTQNYLWKTGLLRINRKGAA